MSRPTLSIIIPSHNRPDLLHACLASVVRHAPPQTEFLVVDDASPRGRASAVARTLGVRCVRLPRRRGFCAAANAGIAAARGAVVELLNDDTEVQAGWVSAALRCFADPRVAAVAPLVLAWPHGDRVDSAGDRYYVGGIAGKRGHGEPLGAAHLQQRAVFGASASSAFYRRDALGAVGGFPESFGAYFEDVDLAFRLQRAGYRAVFAPASRVLHRISASYGRPRRRLLEQQSCNEERVFWRNLPGRVLARALPAHLAVLAAKAWRRWQEGNLTPFLCGRLRVLGDLPALVRHRRRLQALGPAVAMSCWHVEETYWGTAPAA
jgi:GT2 family glycosyltransferase